MNAETLTHISLSIASIIYIVTAFINTVYQIQLSRETELHKITEESVNHIWYSYVKDICGTAEWTIYTKQEAENKAIAYIRQKMKCINCFASDKRLRSWIRTTVENKKRKKYIKNKNNEINIL